MDLAALGPRICVMGPSNAGKSTLADAIGRARGLPVIHLDQLYHAPGTDWVPRPRDQFAALHDAAILGEAWVIDGNYSRLLPRRLEHATGLVLLEVPTWLSLWRYWRRCRAAPGARVGGLDGGRDSLKWIMIHQIAVKARTHRQPYRRALAGFSGARLLLDSPRAIDRAWREWGLVRPGGR